MPEVAGVRSAFEDAHHVEIEIDRRGLMMSASVSTLSLSGGAQVGYRRADCDVCRPFLVGSAEIAAGSANLSSCDAKRTVFA